MPDNLEQLEKEWPQRPPNSSSPQAFTRMYFAGAIVIVAFVNLEAAFFVHQWHSSYPSDPSWVMTAFTLLVALQMPWLFALISHRQIKKLATSTSVNSKMMQQIRHQRIQLIFITYLSIGLILISLYVMGLQEANLRRFNRADLHSVREVVFSETDPAPARSLPVI